MLRYFYLNVNENERKCCWCVDISVSFAKMIPQTNLISDDTLKNISEVSVIDLDTTEVYFDKRIKRIQVQIRMLRI